MHTEILKISEKEPEEDKIQYAANVLRKGGTVAFPTETVYGLGANALNTDAVKKIFIAKGRPADNPLIIHVSSCDDVYKLVQYIPDAAQKLMDEFWPGALTIIMKKSDIVADIITAGLDSVAIRFPSNNIASKLIKAAAIPIAAPSANISGKPSPTKSEHVIDDLMGKVDMIIDGGFSTVGLESTVIDLTAEHPTILRPGGVTYEQIKAIIGTVKVEGLTVGDQAITIDNFNDAPRSPGMKYGHYSPNADVIVIEGTEENIIRTINKMAKEKSDKGLKVGIMATDETIDQYKAYHIISSGSREKPEDIAAGLFSILREFDKLGVDLILVQAGEYSGIGAAIRNRINKAAAGNIITAITETKDKGDY